MTDKHRKKKINIDVGIDGMALFNARIEEIYTECDTYLEAIASYCDSYDCDEQDVLPLISEALKAKLLKEGLANGSLKHDKEDDTELTLFDDED